MSNNKNELPPWEKYGTKEVEVSIEAPQGPYKALKPWERYQRSTSTKEEATGGSQELSSATPEDLSILQDIQRTIINPVGAGITGAISNSLNTMQDLGDLFDEEGERSILNRPVYQGGEWFPDERPNLGNEVGTLSESIPTAEGMVPAGIEGVSQFLTGMVTSPLKGWGPISNAIVRGGVSDFSAFDAKDPLLVESFMEEPLTTNPWERRAARTGEGLVLGGLADLTVRGAKNFLYDPIFNAKASRTAVERGRSSLLGDVIRDAASSERSILEMTAEAVRHQKGEIDKILASGGEVPESMLREFDELTDGIFEELQLLDLSTTLNAAKSLQDAGALLTPLNLRNTKTYVGAGQDRKSLAEVLEIGDASYGEKITTWLQKNLPVPFIDDVLPGSIKKAQRANEKAFNKMYEEFSDKLALSIDRVRKEGLDTSTLQKLNREYPRYIDGTIPELPRKLQQDMLATPGGLDILNEIFMLKKANQLVKGGDSVVPSGVEDAVRGFGLLGSGVISPFLPATPAVVGAFTKLPVQRQISRTRNTLNEILGGEVSKSTMGPENYLAARGINSSIKAAEEEEDQRSKQRGALLSLEIMNNAGNPKANAPFFTSVHNSKIPNGSIREAMEVGAKKFNVQPTKIQLDALVEDFDTFMKGYNKESGLDD